MTAMKNFVLKIELRGEGITRTVAIPADYGFFDLHEIIQIVFGWEDYYYHQFDFGRTAIVDDANEEADLLPEKFRYEYEANLEFFLMNFKNFTYTYDIEQPWVHEVEVEGILEDGFDCPVLLECAGRMIREEILDENETDVSLGDAPNKDFLNAYLKETFYN